MMMLDWKSWELDRPHAIGYPASGTGIFAPVAPILGRVSLLVASLVTAISSRDSTPRRSVLQASEQDDYEWSADSDFDPGVGQDSKVEDGMTP
jgi:hypothetical protein